MPSAEPPLLWLRFENEASQCPACASPRLVLKDAFKIPRDATGRRVAFVAVCRDCGVVFSNPLPSESELRDHYTAEEGTYAAARRRIASKEPGRLSDRDERQLLFDALRPHMDIFGAPKGARVLDFGCGDGKYLDLLQDAGWVTHGIEMSTGVAFGRHARLETPPVDGSMDLVLLHHVLEHLRNPLDVLRQLGRALRPDGVLVLSVPRLDTVGEHGDMKYCLDGRNHVVAFTAVAMRGLLARAGFVDAQVVESPALDEMLTARKRLRLRMVARRGTEQDSTAGQAYEAALEALQAYEARFSSASFFTRLMPVRTRAALLDRAIERRARERRRARA